MQNVKNSIKAGLSSKSFLTQRSMFTFDERSQRVTNTVDVQQLFIAAAAAEEGTVGVGSAQKQERSRSIQNMLSKH